MNIWRSGFRLVAGPLLMWQGKRVRANTPKLPEPRGPRHGVTPEAVSEVPELGLLVLGDSSAAGVGAGTQGETLLGRLLQGLEGPLRVRWRLLAWTGATTKQMLAALEKLGDERFDLVVTALGVNDVTTGIGRKAWLKQTGELHRRLLERHGADLVVVSGFPPVGKFPALPQPLRGYLGARAEDFDAALREQVAFAPQIEFVSPPADMDVSAMASDGFHPGPAVYSAWAQFVLERVVRRGVAGTEML